MKNPKSPLHVWSDQPLNLDVAKSVDRLRHAEDVQHLAIMPDVHLSKDVCVGAVVATQQLIYPSAVGGDIGCGMAAIAIQDSADLLAKEQSARRLLQALSQAVPANKHRQKATLPPTLCETLSHPRLDHLAQREGCVQLGTLGRGNHFLEFQADAEERLWIMLHSGSRAMGQAITRHHLHRSQSSSSGLPFLDATMEAGQAYLHDLAWARRYAAENRLAMLRSVELVLQFLFEVRMDWDSLIHSDHNHLQQEHHFGLDLWVHRKGAQPAGTGAAAVIPGSMGTSSFHAVGKGCPESLLSCSHGAGRILSREAASRRITTCQLQKEMRDVWYDHRRDRQLCDEAPSAYKDIHRVLRAQRDLISIVRELRPLLSYKGV